MHGFVIYWVDLIIIGVELQINHEDLLTVCMDLSFIGWI